MKIGGEKKDEQCQEFHNIYDYLFFVFGYHDFFWC